MTNIEVVVRYYYHWFKCKAFQKAIRTRGATLYRIRSLQREKEKKSFDTVLQMIDELQVQIQSLAASTVDADANN
jgi:hypothetical protein